MLELLILSAFLSDHFTKGYCFGYLELLEWQTTSNRSTSELTHQSWAIRWALGCVNSDPAAIRSPEMGFPQPRTHLISHLDSHSRPVKPDRFHCRSEKKQRATQIERWNQFSPPPSPSAPNRCRSDLPRHRYHHHLLPSHLPLNILPSQNLTLTKY